MRHLLQILFVFLVCVASTYTASFYLPSQLVQPFTVIFAVYGVYILVQLNRIQVSPVAVPLENPRLSQDSVTNSSNVSSQTVEGLEETDEISMQVYLNGGDIGMNPEINFPVFNLFFVAKEGYQEEVNKLFALDPAIQQELLKDGHHLSNEFFNMVTLKRKELSHSVRRKTIKVYFSELSPPKLPFLMSQDINGWILRNFPEFGDKPEDVWFKAARSLMLQSLNGYLKTTKRPSQALRRLNEADQFTQQREAINFRYKQQLQASSQYRLQLNSQPEVDRASNSVWVKQYPASVLSGT